MKSFKVNAKVIKNFNDSTKLNENNEPYKWEKDEVIKDMPRERFEKLQALGYVVEDKSFTSKSKEEWE